MSSEGIFWQHCLLGKNPVLIINYFMLGNVHRDSWCSSNLKSFKGIMVVQLCYNWAAGKGKKEERTDEVDAAGLAEVQVRVKEGGLRRSNSKTTEFPPARLT